MFGWAQRYSGNVNKIPSPRLPTFADWREESIHRVGNVCGISDDLEGNANLMVKVLRLFLFFGL